MQLSLRPATSEDLRFVRSSWFESYRKDSGVDFETYREGMNKLIDGLVGETINFVQVGCLHEVPDEIVGWVCWWGNAVHYVYVKQAYRKQGFGRVLVGPLANEYTLQTRAGAAFAKKLGLRFNPFLLMNP